MNLLITNIYIFVLATVLALLEIQIEGPNGWARNLPTWRPKRHKWYAKLYERAMAGKELTGYHVVMFLFVLMIFHLPYFLGTSLSWKNEFKILPLYLIFLALWDYLWFVLNPFYPIKDFARENVNHKVFFLGMPTDYWWIVGISFLSVLVGKFIFNIDNLDWWFLNMALFIGETSVLILFSIFVLDIDNWIDKKS